MRTPNLEALGRQLRRMQQSPQFNKSRRLSDFLSYVCHETIKGNGDRLKAYTIAVAVFGRSADFDPSTDSIVRVQARQLRLKLLQYYDEAHEDDEIVITIPNGTYQPTFSAAKIASRARSPQPDAPIEAKPRGLPRVLIAAPSLVEGGDGAMSEVSAGISQELGHALSRYSDSHVVAPHSDTSQGAVVSPEADYELVCITREVGGQTRVSFQVLRSVDRVILWAQNFDYPAETLTLQEQQNLAQTVTARIAGPTGIIATLEIKALGTSMTAFTASYSALLHAYRYLGNPSGRRHNDTRALLEAALQDDPNDANALAMLVLVSLRGKVFAFDEEQERETAITRARVLSERAVDADQNNAMAWFHFALVEYEDRNFDLFMEYGKRAYALNETHSYIAVEYGHHLWQCGQVDEGLAIVDKALSLQSQVPNAYHFAQVHDHIMNNRLEDALSLVDQVVMPDFFWVNVLKAGLNGSLGNKDLAMLEATKAELRHPDIIQRIADDRIDWNFPSDFRRNLAAGIRALREV